MALIVHVPRPRLGGSVQQQALAVKYVAALLGGHRSAAPSGVVGARALLQRGQPTLAGRLSRALAPRTAFREAPLALCVVVVANVLLVATCPSGTTDLETSRTSWDNGVVFLLENRHGRDVF